MPVSIARPPVQPARGLACVTFKAVVSFALSHNTSLCVMELRQKRSHPTNSQQHEDEGNAVSIPAGCPVPSSKEKKKKQQVVSWTPSRDGHGSAHSMHI